MGNVSGPIPGMGELEELRFVDPKLAVRVINENKEFIVGLKVRCSEPISGPNDLEAVRRTRLAADEVHLPLMMHIGASYSPLPPLLAELKQGDVLTHPYHGRSHGVLNADGKIVPEVIEARKRGVVFDVGHGGGNFSWTVAENCMKQDFAPDTISSDLGVLNLNGPVYDLATTLSKFLFLGLSLGDVVAKATINPSRVFDFGSSLGSLRPGADADVSVFDLANGDFTLTDSEGKTRQGRQKLVPVVTLRGSKLFYPASSPNPSLTG
jgi:dihydroorotase